MIMTRSRPALALGALSLLTWCTTAPGADQPQWGQRHSRNMVSAEQGLPDRFDPKTGENVRWTAALGSEAHGSPIVGGGRVLIGTNNERPRDAAHKGDRGVLMCFEEQTGRFLWQSVVPKYSHDPYQDWPRAGMSSTPTIDGRRVFMLSNRGEVMCLDLDGLANGNDGPFREETRFLTPPGADTEPLGEADADLLWVFDVHAQVGTYPHDAAHSSFLLDGDCLYLNTSTGVDNTHRLIRRPEAPSLIVLDRRTGRLLAQDAERIGPRIFHSTWSSPALGEVDGRRLVVFCGGDGVVYAFEALPQPDAMKASVRAEAAGTAASSPATSGSAPGEPPGAGSGPGAGAASDAVRRLKKVWSFDCDPTAPKDNVHRFITNRRESPSNIKSMPVFHKNRVYVTVGGDVWWGKNQAWLKCIDATRTGDITQGGELWSYPLDQHVMSTPAIQDGLVYAADCGGKIHCVEAETGKAVWVHDAQGEVWASTLVADGKVYVGTRAGRFWILAAGREKRVLSTVDLGAPISATATAANGVIYVATMRELLAVARAGR